MSNFIRSYVKNIDIGACIGIQGARLHSIDPNLKNWIIAMLTCKLIVAKVGSCVR